MKQAVFDSYNHQERQNPYDVKQLAQQHQNRIGFKQTKK
jgi:hypothetical protein